MSPQQDLNHNQNVPLVIIAFTDATRASGSLQGGSYLVNYFNPNYNSQFAFQNFIDFKNNRDARFVIIHRQTDNLSIQAAAGISSNGGSYYGNLEYYQGDPEYGNTPKFYYQQSDFVYQQSVSDEILQNFCKFDGYVKFFYEKQETCTNPTDPAYGSVFNGKFVLPYGGTYQYMKLFAVNTVTNAEIPVNFYPLVTGNTFSYQIQLNDIMPVPVTGAFKLRLDLTFDFNGNSHTITSWNNYPDSFFGGSNINFGICKNGQAIKNILIDSHQEKIDKNADPNNLNQKLFTDNNIFKLSPNPTNGIFSITLDEYTSGRLDITDINGINIYTESFKNKKTIDLDIQSRIKGIYIVKITNNKGETSIKKVLKN